MSLREEAEYFRVGIAVGLLAVADAAAWADGVVAVSDEPPIEVIDVALAGAQGWHEMLDLLRTVPGAGDFEAAAHRVLRLMRSRKRAGEVDLKTVVKMLDAYSTWAGVGDGERLEASNLQWLWMTAVAGDYGTVDWVEERLDVFFGKYCGGP